MLEEERRRVSRTGFSVKDGKPFYLCCAVKSLVPLNAPQSVG